MPKKKNSTKELIGVRHLTRNGLMTDHGELVFFRVQPTNLSVLSEETVEIRIRRLKQLLSVQPDIEIICSDARENFEQIKIFLAKRTEQEQNPKIQQLLRKDRKFLDDIQLQMSTSRNFYFCYRITGGSEEQSFAALNRLEKQINDQGFECRRAAKSEIKQFIARYFGHLSEEPPEDLDGETAIRRWFIPEN